MKFSKRYIVILGPLSSVWVWPSSTISPRLQNIIIEILNFTKIEILPNDLHRAKPHFRSKFTPESFAEFSSTIKSRPGLESPMPSRQLVSIKRNGKNFTLPCSTKCSFHWHFRFCTLIIFTKQNHNAMFSFRLHPSSLWTHEVIAIYQIWQKYLCEITACIFLSIWTMIFF